MAYRIFTTEDLKSYGGGASGYPFSGLQPPYRCLTYNDFYNNYSIPYAIGFAMRTADKNDYIANPTKLMLRRHIYIETIDRWNNGPVYPDV